MSTIRGVSAAVVAAALFAAPFMAGQAGADDTPPEPPGYRSGDYRAPTPDTLTGAITVSDDEAMMLRTSGAVLFIDVMPRPVRPANLPAETIFHPPERRNIPGSTWLPNTGYGVLSAPVADYFRKSLEHLTKGDKDRPMLIYCLENCWMSWNAAKRALELGYRRVYWYPAGTDGWVRNAGALEIAEPFSPDP